MHDQLLVGHNWSQLTSNPSNKMENSLNMLNPFSKAIMQEKV